MINIKLGFLIIFAVLFLMYFILKKHIENFNTLVINGDLDKKNNYQKDLFKFNKLCVGKTCMDSNILASVIDLFKSNDDTIIESMCNDNVCLFSPHLKMFNNTYSAKPKIYNISNESDISKIVSFKDKKGLPDSNGFKMALVEDTDTLLSQFNEKETRYKTKMMSGRICYSPNTSSKYNLSFYDINTYFPEKKSQKEISNYTDCYNGKSQNFRMGKPYDMLNKVNLNIDSNVKNEIRPEKGIKKKYNEEIIKIIDI